MLYAGWSLNARAVLNSSPLLDGTGLDGTGLDEGGARRGGFC